MIFSAELGLERRRRIGDGLVGNAEFGRHFDDPVAPAQEPQDLELAYAHLGQGTGLDRRTGEGRGFGQSGRDEAFARGDLPDCLGQDSGSSLFETYP
jgi:hypothetical protein